MTVKDCGGFLKKLTLWVLIIGLVAVVVGLISTVAPLAKYDSDEANQAIGAAWLSAGISAGGVFVGSVFLYVFGDIAQKVSEIAGGHGKKK